MKKSLLITAVLSAFLLGILDSSSLAAEKGPIKIGSLNALSGVFAEAGKDQLRGLEMYLEEIGYKAAGRKIVVVSEDTRGIPDTVITKFRKLVEHDKVAMVTGLITAPSGLAGADIADKMETPLMIASSAADDNTQRLQKKWAIRISWTGSQPSFPFGEWVYKKLGYKKVVMMAVDFQFGYDTVGGFQKTFEEAGGQVIQKIWFPPTTMDYGPYFPAIRRDADAVWVNAIAGGALKFPKQYQEAGIKLPLIGCGVLSDEFILGAQGDEILGYISALHYTAAIDTPANKEFQKKYQKKYKKVASYYAVNSYEAAMWIVQAIGAVKGDVEKKEAFLQALKNVKLTNAPRGPFSMDKYGQAVQNIYIRKVEKIKGYPLDFLGTEPIKWNVIIDTIPAVSQFWKWNPEEYMKQPAYSQDYPPCKYCK